MSSTTLLRMDIMYHCDVCRYIFKPLMWRIVTCTGFEEQKDHQLMSMVSSIVKCSETIRVSVEVLKQNSNQIFGRQDLQSEEIQQFAEDSELRYPE